MILFLKEQTLKLFKQDYTPQEVLQFAFGCEGGDTEGKESRIRKEETCSVLQRRLGDPGLNIMTDTRACLREKWLNHCFYKCWTRVLSIKHPCLQQLSLHLSSSTASQAPVLCKPSASTNHLLIGESRFQTCLGPSVPGAGDKTGGSSCSPDSGAALHAASFPSSDMKAKREESALRPDWHSLCHGILLH